ncbi:hypothetical protein BCR33DRAFT_50326 [Rhizoclosmatium globosum]|uniref:G protein-coupled receptor n=1 Tax=Rhizoclosmatium globosum TaxID=329046 RepID=A0A1Y2AV22_9FUNG|nr:hypothetical protein BCR33DRAFT_50326 [Rhizoclosmatium globosum]|eukprot:ORY26421.1 hypothetical protein BCR33DRAFT_50326 [Rhizoclosmatium globosum]
MNSTDSTVIQQGGIVGTYSILSFISFCTVVTVARFIVTQEIPLQGKDLTLASIFSPINVLLLLGCVSLMTIYIVRAINCSISLDVGVGTLFTIEQFCLATCETCYIFFSFKRSSKLFKIVLGYWAHSFIWYLTVLSPICFYSTLIPSLWPAAMPSSTKYAVFMTEVVAGSCVAIIDCLFVWAYITFIRRTHIDGEAPNEEFSVVAHTGMMACCTVFLSTILYGASFAFADIRKHVVLVASSQAVLVVLPMIQFRMKVLLFKIRGMDSISIDVGTKNRILSGDGMDAKLFGVRRFSTQPVRYSVTNKTSTL